MFHVGVEPRHIAQQSIVQPLRQAFRQNHLRSVCIVNRFFPSRVTIGSSFYFIRPCLISYVYVIFKLGIGSSLLYLHHLYLLQQQPDFH